MSHVTNQEDVALAILGRGSLDRGSLGLGEGHPYRLLHSVRKPAAFTSFSMLAIIAGFFQVVGVLKLYSTWRSRHLGTEVSKNFSISRCRHLR